MLAYLILAYGFDENNRYNLKSKDFPPKNIGLENGTVRFFKPEVIQSKIKDVIDELSIVLINGNTHNIVFSNGRHLCRDGVRGYGVITCAKNAKYTDWIIKSFEDSNGYTIKQNGDCLTVHTFNEKFNGNYVQTRKCNGSIHQVFDIVKIEEAIPEVSETISDANQQKPEEEENKKENIEKIEAPVNVIHVKNHVIHEFVHSSIGANTNQTPESSDDQTKKDKKCNPKPQRWLKN